MVVTLLGVPGMATGQGRQRSGTSCGSAPIGISEALALERERGLGGLWPVIALQAYTNSEPWRMQVVLAFRPERTKSSVGVSLGKSEFTLELIPVHV